MASRSTAANKKRAKQITSKNQSEGTLPRHDPNSSLNKQTTNVPYSYNMSNVKMSHPTAAILEMKHSTKITNKTSAVVSPKTALSELPLHTITSVGTDSNLEQVGKVRKFDDGNTIVG